MGGIAALGVATALWFAAAFGLQAAVPDRIALPQVAMAGALILGLTLAVERPPDGLVHVPPSPAAWFSVLWLGVLGSGAAYLLYFRLIRSWGATRTSLVTYALPVVGIALGVIVLSEALHPAEIVGALLILGGLVLANIAVGQRRLFGRRPATASARCARNSLSPPSEPSATVRPRRSVIERIGLSARTIRWR